MGLEVFNLVPKVVSDHSRCKGYTASVKLFEKGVEETKHGHFGGGKEKRNLLACSVVRFEEIHDSLGIDRTLNRVFVFQVNTNMA